MSTQPENDPASPSALALEFDQYQRYRHCTELMLQVAGDDADQLTVLEVGSNVLNLLPLFLGARAQRVVRCDLQEPREGDEDYVQISADAPLPFEDASFDFVVAMDVLEHVAPEQRRTFLAEVSRVSRLATVVGFPRGDDDVRESEATMNAIFRTTRGTEHPFLAEHAEFGLPDPRAVDSTLESLGLAFRAYDNSPLKAWLGCSTLCNLLHLQGDQSVLLELFNTEYNRHYYGAFEDSPGYRLLYVVSDPQTIAALDAPPLREPLAPALVGPTCWVGFAHILQWFLGRLQSTNVESRFEFSEHEAKIRAITSQNAELQESLLAERRARSEERAGTIALTNQLQDQLAALRSIAPRANLVGRTLTRVRSAPRRIRHLLGSTAGKVAGVAARKLPRLARWANARLPGLARRLGGASGPVGTDVYKGWYKAHAPGAAHIATMRHVVAFWNDAPLISLVTPVYNVPAEWLEACIRSVREQAYTNWELCIADDASTEPHIREILERHAGEDPRIRVTFLEQNGGISAASNAALELARGEFTALLDNDDEIPPHALFEVATAVHGDPTIDYLYTDEDKIDTKGRHSAPMFKPDWSPEHFLSTHYPCHFSVFRTALLRDIGGFRSDFDGSQDYDICLRATESARKVHHIPKVLYHWRMIPGSAAEDQSAKPLAHDAARRALSEALARRNLGGTVEETALLGLWRARPAIVDRPLVSLVIPTAGRMGNVRGQPVDLLLHCITSVVSKSTWPNLEFVVVHNGDLSDEQLTALDAVDAEIRLVHFARPFNLSEKMNLGVEQARGEHCILLNDDIEVISEDWIESMLEWGQQHDVGAVGSTLLYPDGRLQHAGVVLLNGVPHHSYLGFGHQTAGHLGMLYCVRNTLAVTGACLMIRRAVYLDVGGFDPDLPLNYNDVDLCLRLAQHGLRCVVTPHAKLFHFEGVSKSTGGMDIELARFLDRHPDLATGAARDPYYNPNFDQSIPYFELPGVRHHAGSPPPPSRQDAGAPATCYSTWIQHRISERRAQYTETIDPGLLSLITPIYNTPRKFLEDLAQSVFRQTWHQFEWILADDGSTSSETKAVLARLEQDPRVRVVTLETNGGIQAGMRAAFEAATGRYVIPLDHDDRLYPDALAIMGSTIIRSGYPALLYSDEDKINKNGDAHSPFFKPDWDPVLFLNCCYTTHLGAIDRSLAGELGLYTDPDTAGCTDYDAFLRFVAAGHEPLHVPEVIYSWRIHPGSTADSKSKSKPYTIVHQEHALGRFLASHPRGAEFELVLNTLLTPPSTWRLHRKDRTPPECTALVIGADDASFARVSALWQAQGIARAERIETFDQLLACARAAVRAKQPIILCAASVTRVSADWAVEAATLLEFHANVVAVGGRAVDAKGRIVEGGGALGFESQFGYPDRGLSRNAPGYHGLLLQQRRVGVLSLSAAMIEPGFLVEVLADAEGGLDRHALERRIATCALERGRLLAQNPLCEVTMAATAANSRPRSAERSPPPTESATPTDPSYPRFLGRVPSTAFALVWPDRRTAKSNPTEQRTA